MAKSGLSKLYCARYTWNETGNTVTYSNGKKYAKMVELSIDPGDDGGSSFYADNGVAETANSFGSGTLSITGDDFTLQDMADLVGAQYDTQKSELHFNADDVAPYMGVGTIIRHQRSNVVTYRAVLLPKVAFIRPGDEASSQEENIEFSGLEVSGNILRSDDNGDWKVMAEFADEAAAETWIKGKLNITE